MGQGLPIPLLLSLIWTTSRTEFQVEGLDHSGHQYYIWHGPVSRSRAPYNSLGLRRARNPSPPVLCRGRPRQRGALK